MKLALFSCDFGENLITFLVPEPVMLEMGFYPCELEVGVEEIMRNKPEKPTDPKDASIAELESVASQLKRLAIAIYSKHYKDLTQWQPLSGDAVGLVTQIDNMVAGLSSRIAELEESLGEAKKLAIEFDKIILDAATDFVDQNGCKPLWFKRYAEARAVLERKSEVQE